MTNNSQTLLKKQKITRNVQKGEQNITKYNKNYQRKPGNK
jgi:hypothetical protein